MEHQGVPSGDAVRDGTPDAPLYSKFKLKQDELNATSLWAIQVNEGWRSWILCIGMYEWAADELLERLRESNRRWEHGDGA